MMGLAKMGTQRETPRLRGHDMGAGGVSSGHCGP